MDKFFQAYVECALWSSTDDNDQPLDKNYGIGDLAPATIATMQDDCLAFQQANGEAIGSEWKQAGHDFWLTRNRHGAGFWDGDWSEPAASILTSAAHAFGECNLYIGDDGLIYS